MDLKSLIVKEFSKLFDYKEVEYYFTDIWFREISLKKGKTLGPFDDNVIFSGICIRWKGRFEFDVNAYEPLQKDTMEDVDKKKLDYETITDDDNEECIDMGDYMDFLFSIDMSHQEETPSL